MPVPFPHSIPRGSHFGYEEALAERNKRIVVTLTANPSLPKEDEYALIYHQAEQLYDNRNVIPVVCCAGTVLAFLCFIFLFSTSDPVLTDGSSSMISELP